MVFFSKAFAARLGAWMWACAVPMFMLAACTPAYDWREVADTPHGYAALFPDKPVTVSRELVIAGEKLTLTLQSAKVGDTYFAVGVAPLNPSQQARGQEIVQALIAAMVNNVGATPEQAQPLDWRDRRWLKVKAQSPSQASDARRLEGRFLLEQGRVVEVIAMGQQDALTEELSSQFFDGFRWTGAR